MRPSLEFWFNGLTDYDYCHSLKRFLIINEPKKVKIKKRLMYKKIGFINILYSAYIVSYSAYIVSWDYFTFDSILSS